MMQLQRLPATARGRTDLGWLDSRHSFSFGEYHDPARMGFHALRVINDDRVSPGMGFGAHPHRDMEILSYVVSGALTHQDSMGNTKTVEAGGVQAMSAGSGVRHSEFNASQTEPVRFLQVWILPAQKGLIPRYSEWRRPSSAGLHLAASPDGEGGSIHIHQDARMFVGLLEAEPLVHETLAHRAGWLQVIQGDLNVNGVALGEGDAVSWTGDGRLTLQPSGSSQFLLFDLAAD